MDIINDFSLYSLLFQEGETLKVIPGYEGLYVMSKEGEVKSIKRNKIIKPYNDRGHKGIGLCKNGKVKKFRVSKLCKLTFSPKNYR